MFYELFFLFYSFIGVTHNNKTYHILKEYWQFHKTIYLSSSSYLQQVIQETTCQDVLYLDLAYPHGIEEKEELSHCRTHIEWVKWLLQTIQLKQMGGK